MKKLLVCLLALLLAAAPALGEDLPSWVTDGGDAAREPLEGPGFDSPKEAVTAYLEALKNGDARGMLSTFAIETYVSEMDAQAELERYGAFIPTIGIRVPLGGDYQQQVAVAARYGQLAESLAYQWMLFSWPEGYEEFGGTTISLTEDGAAEAFLTNLAENDAAARWQEMEVVGFVEPELMSTQYSDGAESRARQAASYGCDEIVSVVANWTSRRGMVPVHGRRLLWREVAQPFVRRLHRSFDGAFGLFRRPCPGRSVLSGLPAAKRRPAKSRGGAFHARFVQNAAALVVVPPGAVQRLEQGRVSGGVQPRLGEPFVGDRRKPHLPAAVKADVLGKAVRHRLEGIGPESTTSRACAQA